MNKKAFYFIIVIIMIAFPAFNIAGNFFAPENEAADVSQGISVIDENAKTDAKQVEKEIRQLRAALQSVGATQPSSSNQSGSSASSKVSEVLRALENDEITYAQVFADVCIVGDSLMETLDAAEILNSDRMVTQVSASLDHFYENLDSIIAMNPAVIISHYGNNLLSDSSYILENFIAEYEDIITQLKSALPDTRIIISGVFPVDESVREYDYHEYIPSYNEQLIKLAQSMKVEYLSSDNIVSQNADYYEPDGIHLRSSFYYDCWLPFVIEEKGIVG